MYDEIDGKKFMEIVELKLLYKLSDYVNNGKKKNQKNLNDAHVFVLLISWVVKILWEKKCIQWEIKQIKEKKTHICLSPFSLYYEQMMDMWTSSKSDSLFYISISFNLGFVTKTISSSL